MATFANAVKTQTTTTTNGMKAYKDTGNSVVSLFYKIGASRGKDITKDFVAAFAENKELTLRVAQWARDVRGGAGERQIFKDILVYLEKSDPEAASLVMNKVPELGRWDDLLVFTDEKLKAQAFGLIKTALNEGNGLCAKWLPRKGPVAAELRKFMEMTPKTYRKTLVGLTNVVEQKMCSRQWNSIDFSKLPSLASARYRTAFHKNSEKFKEYVAKLAAGDKSVKVNANAVYPYDVLKSVIMQGWGAKTLTKTDRDFIVAQWEALPNFVGDANILPMVDVSGSMSCPAGGPRSKSSVRCIDVAISLGLYLADKNKGLFKDVFCTFSSKPELLNLKGNVIQKAEQMEKSSWEMGTNVIAAFKKVLDVAVKGNVSDQEMPKVLLIMSDMNFDSSVAHGFDKNALDSMKILYRNSGYALPAVVYWNINAQDHVPVKFDQKGTALVSGFSPTIVKSILSVDLDSMTPEAIMMQTIMVDRYDLD
jgi:hypothetical protein